MTSQSGNDTFIFSKFTLPLRFLRTIELPFVVIMFNCLQCYVNNCIQSFTSSCVFPMIVPSYVIQGQGVTVTADIMSQLRKLEFKKPSRY